MAGLDYAGFEYRIEDSENSGNTLTFQAAQLDDAGNVGLYVAVEDVNGVSSTVLIRASDLSEFHNAVTGALAAAATNGIRLAEEAEEKQKQEATRAFLKRHGLDKLFGNPPAEPS